MLGLFILGPVLLASSYAGKVSFITPCHLSDSACLIRSAQAALPHIADGLPELRIPPSDPLVLDDVKSNEGGLNLHFKNLKVTRTKECQFKTMKMAPDHSVLNFVMHCPITATGQYTVGGKLLAVKVEGNGDCEIKTDNLKISIEAHLEDVDGSDGQKHWHIKDLIHSYEPLEKFHFRLDNLFGGNKEKAKPALDILNQSWKEVLLTIGKPIIQEITNKVKDHMNDFLAAVPARELFVA